MSRPERYTFWKHHCQPVVQEGVKTSKEERELRLSAVAQSYGRICFTTLLESFQRALEDVTLFNGLPTPKKTQFPEMCCLDGSECVGIVCFASDGCEGHLQFWQTSNLQVAPLFHVQKWWHVVIHCKMHMIWLWLWIWYDYNMTMNMNMIWIWHDYDMIWIWYEYEYDMIWIWKCAQSAVLVSKAAIRTRRSKSTGPVWLAAEGGGLSKRNHVMIDP